MDGYDFITMVDDKRWGTVVGESGEYVIVEHGTLRKHRYAVPKASIDVDADAKEVRTTLSGELIGESPVVDDGFDNAAVEQHYGLGDTSGLEGGETATEERARIREGSAEATDGMPDESPALLGDRLSDVRDER
ncbi:MAG TPA: hypothetical protein VFM13_01820 [Gaiellaceae bacterium]|nr:hypothetical protein [Gaiellaceae bacterium]